MKNLIRKKKLSFNSPLIRAIILIATILLLILLWQYRRMLYQFENLGYAGLFTVNVFSNATVFLPFPSIMAVFIGGSVWNPLFVGIVSGAGNAIGELIGFFLGFGSRGILDKLDSWELRWFKKMEKWFKKSGFITIFIFSLLPFPIFDLIGILAGTLNYSLWKFFLATVMGRVIRNFIVAWSGAKFIP